MRFAFFVFIFLFFSTLLAQAQSVCVRTAGAKLWYKPDYKQKPVWRAMRFTPLLATGKKVGPFIEVTNIENTVFWIQKNDISTNINCIVVKAKTATLRKGPGEKYDLAKNKVAERHEAFRDLGGEDGWTLVQDDTGEVSWIDLEKTWKPKSKIRLSFDREK